MAEIFLFKPNKAISAAENLSAFIRKCRDELTVFGADLDWENVVWPNLMVFSKLGVITRKPRDDEAMSAEFMPFAKAYFRYQQGHSPTGTKNESKALRAIEAALQQMTGAADISQLSVPVLDLAAQLGSEHYSAGASYHCSREIERLANFVTENRLGQNSLRGWRSPIRRPDDRNKTGKKGQEQRKKRMPNQRALDALAEIFSNKPTDPRDVFTVSVFAILMCSPIRISEALALPVDCEVMLPDKSGQPQYVWRSYSGKGFEGYIKDIPTVMVPIAKEAVRRLRDLSEDARKLAEWIEENPARFYRHADCPDATDDEPLTMIQAAQALGLVHATRKEARVSLRNRGLAEEDAVHTLNSLWQHVRGRLPEDFPWFDKARKLKFGQALCVINKNQLDSIRACLPVELQKPNVNVFNNDLSPRESLDSDHRNIFDRYRFSDEDGQRLKLTSHQARHLLNTIANRGGLSQVDIAKWSGRADIKQNRNYNNMESMELVKLAEKIDPNKSLYGPLGEVAKHVPVTSQEFNIMDHGAVHVTEYGFCVHDYLISPCEKYRDCINCTEQVCVKGNLVGLERLKARLERTELLFARASHDVENGTTSADRWFGYQEKTLARLTELVSILESENVPDGAQIKLRGNDFTQLRRVIDKKAVQSIEMKSDEQFLLEDVRAMLGGGLG